MLRLELDLPIREKTIAIRRHYRIKFPDAVIAAAALVNGAILISNDLGFDKITNLQRLNLTLKS